RNPHFKKDYPVSTIKRAGDRFPDIFPNIKTLIKIPSSEEDDYFHANEVRIDDLRFISTQTPTQQTQEKFWTMVNLHDCGVIIN
ncbi:protein-tyrosine phosphatase family protein, partial [Acinetobacter baumannii]